MPGAIAALGDRGSRPLNPVERSIDRSARSYERSPRWDDRSARSGTGSSLQRAAPMRPGMSLRSYLDALEAARPFLRGAPRRATLRGRWYRDSLELCWACLYALEQGPQHFRHLSFEPAALRAELERLRELQVARDAAEALLADTQGELDACKRAVSEQAQEVVRTVECRLRDPQRAEHGGLLALTARLRQILGRRSERLRGRHRASSLDAEALLAENRRLQEENQRLRGSGEAPTLPSAERD